jgi:hypothetical protein
MIGNTKAIQLKLFLEGLEIPLHSLQLVEEVGSVPRCIIQLPLDDTVLDIEPRTLVHIFYKDNLTEGR